MSFSDVHEGAAGTLHVDDRHIPIGNWSFAMPADINKGERGVTAQEELAGTFLIHADDAAWLPVNGPKSGCVLRAHVDDTRLNYAEMPIAVIQFNPLTCDVAFRGIGPISLHGTLADTRMK